MAIPSPAGAPGYGVGECAWPGCAGGGSLECSEINGCVVDAITDASVDILTNKDILSGTNRINLSTVAVQGIAADEVILGNSADAADYATIPICNSNSFLNYASGAFGCADPSTTTGSLTNKTIAASTNLLDLSAGVTVTGITDDDIVIGDGAGTTIYTGIPDCNGGNHLTYTASTHTFGCD